MNTSTTQALVKRYRVTDIEAAVRDGGLVPARLSLFDSMRLRLERRPSTRLVDKAVRAAQADELKETGLDPYSFTEAEDNLETYTGINNMLLLLIGQPAANGTLYAHGLARLCVGDGNGSIPTVLPTDVTLAATTNVYNQACDLTYPNVPAGGNDPESAILNVQATFDYATANFPWNEWAMDKGGVSSSSPILAGDIFNHRGIYLGTKTTRAAWALQVTIIQS